MVIEDLKYRISIISVTRTPDGLGGYINKQVVSGTCYAGLKFKSSSVYVDNHIETVYTLEVTVRDRVDILASSNIYFEGKYYVINDIVKIDNELKKLICSYD